MDLKPDVVVGKKYRILRKLFESSRGAVYLASHLLTERRVTLEVSRRDGDPAGSGRVPTSRAGRDTMRSSGVGIRAELRALSVRTGVRSRAAEHVAHRGLIEPLETGAEGADVWVALELMRGETLAKRLEGGPLELAELRFVFSALLDIVAALHRAGIVHGHLSPERVFLEENATGGVRVRLLDFEVVEHDGRLFGTHSSASTAVVVPRAFLSPEQRAEERAEQVVDASSDVFALGAVLFACLSAQRPLDLARLAARTASNAGELPLELDEPALEPYATVAGYCLAFDPARRPGSCEDLRRVFEMGGSRPPPLPRPSTPPVSRKRRVRSWLGLASVVLAGIGLALFARRGESPPPEREQQQSAAPAGASESAVLTTRVEPMRSLTRSLLSRPLGDAPKKSVAATAQQAPRPPHTSRGEPSVVSAPQGARFDVVPPRFVRAPDNTLRPTRAPESAHRLSAGGAAAYVQHPRVAPRGGRIERSYRLDVEGTPIARVDESPSPEAATTDGRVRDALRRSAAQLERCYDAALRASLDAQLRAIGLAAEVTIEPSGETSAVLMDGDAPDELIECIRGHVSKWKFPETEGRASYRVPLDFSGAGRVQE